MKKIVIVGLLFCLLFVFSGCGSNISIPKSELQQEAYGIISNDYSDASSLKLESDSYDSNNLCYDMRYRVEQQSQHGFINSYKVIRARSVYDESTKTWSRVYTTVEDGDAIPNLNRVKKLSATSEYGGDVTIELLSVDEKAKTITANIYANNLVTVEVNSIFQDQHSVNVQKRNIKGDYSVAWQGEQFQVIFENCDGQDLILIVRYLNGFGLDKPSYLLRVGPKDELVRIGQIELSEN